MYKEYLDSSLTIIKELKELITSSEKLMLYNFCKNKGKHEILLMMYKNIHSIYHMYASFSNDPEYLSQLEPSLHRAKKIYLILLYTEYGRRSIIVQQKISDNLNNCSAYFGVGIFASETLQFLYNYEMQPVNWFWDEKSPFDD